MNPQAATTNWLSPATGKARPLSYLSAFLISASHLGVTTEVKM